MFVQSIDNPNFAEFYANNLRQSLFAGFLTLAAFLYSLKTFIIIKMKENVYDQKLYKERFDRKKKNNPNIKRYDALRQLSDLLFYTVLCSIITSIMQFTLGLYSHWMASILCLYMALVSVVLFSISIFIIKDNLNAWFDFLDESEKKAENKKTK